MLQYLSINKIKSEYESFVAATGCTKNQSSETVILFFNLDQNNDQRIDIEEFVNTYIQNPTEEQLTYLFSIFARGDTNGDEVLDFQEFLKLYSIVRPQLKQEFFARVAYALDWIHDTINHTGKFCSHP